MATVQAVSSVAVKLEEKLRVKGRWASAIVLSFTLMLDNNEGSSFIVSLFPVVRAALGLTLGDLGFLNAIPKLIAMVFGPLWASIGRKYSRKNILIFTTAVWGLWSLGIGMAQNSWQLYVFLIISMIGVVAGQPLIQELMTDLFNDDERGKAASTIYGLGAIIMLPIFVINGWVSTIDNGWRYMYYAAAGINVLGGILIWLFLKDPGRGATEAELSKDKQTIQKNYGFVKWSEVRELFKIKTFVLMLGQRLLSGHLLFLSMGVVYMVDVLGFDTKTANLLMIPLLLGSVSGMTVFGFIADRIHVKFPKYGRIGAIQAIQFVYAFLAVLGTQILHGSMIYYGVIFFLMGFFGSANLGVNRPIVASVVRPELRGTAFAIMVSVFESIGWAIYSIVAGQLGQIFGLQPVFFGILVVLMLVNTLFITLLYKPYSKDVQTLHKQLSQGS